MCYRARGETQHFDWLQSLEHPGLLDNDGVTSSVLYNLLHRALLCQGAGHGSYSLEPTLTLTDFLCQKKILIYIHTVHEYIYRQ